MNCDLLVTAKSTKLTVQEERLRALTGPHLHGREATQAQFTLLCHVAHRDRYPQPGSHADLLALEFFRERIFKFGPATAHWLPAIFEVGIT